ncbi:MAG TPA: hypothetical protein VGB91_09930, partial [Rhizomicrobium sp.]
VSPVAPVAVGASLIFFFVVYNCLLLAFFWYGFKIVLRGPAGTDAAPPHAVRPGLDEAVLGAGSAKGG